MKRSLFIFSLTALIFSITGCATTQSQLTSLQRRVIEEKELEGDLDDVFRATIAVLQDKGYQIKNSDSQGGLISAETAKEVTNNVWYFKRAYKITISLEKFTENRTKMRLSIFRQMYNSSGVEIPEAPDSQKLRSGFEDNSKVYQDFFSEVQQEMFRRAQLNK